MKMQKRVGVRVRQSSTMAIPHRSGRVLGLLLVLAFPAHAERIKELVEIEGVRPNALVGMGLVVGLNGSGDDASSPVTHRALTALMKNLDINMDPTQQKQLKARNVAMATVTATLPPFARPGMALDVVVSSAGSARSLQGGTLLLTPLRGPDLKTYAVAQGPVSLGGFSAEGQTGSRVVKNHPTVGTIPGGGRVERAAPSVLADKGDIVLLLREPDFTTASRLVKAINDSLGKGVASVRDPGAATIKIMENWQGYVVDMVSVIEAIEVIPDAVAKVIVDERTGTLVVGSAVRLGAAVIAHGGITVRVEERQVPSQPGPFSKKGETVVVPETKVSVEEEPGRLTVMTGAATIGDVAKALNTLGVKPRDLVAIFQALARAGALRAEIVVL